MRQAALNQESREIAALASLIDAEIAVAAREAAHEVECPSLPIETRPPWRPLASYRTLTLSWILCLGLTVINLEFGGLFTPKAEELDPFELVIGLKTSAAMDAVLIDNFLSEHGALPFSLADVGLPDNDPTLEYQRAEGQSYRVIARHGEYEGIYDSKLAAQRRASVARARAEEEERRATEQEEQLANSELWLVETQERAEEYRRARGDYDREPVQ